MTLTVTSGRRLRNPRLKQAITDVTYPDASTDPAVVQTPSEPGGYWHPLRCGPRPTPGVSTGDLLEGLSQEW